MNDIGLSKTPELGLSETESSADRKRSFRATHRKSASISPLNHANRRIDRSFLTARLAPAAVPLGLTERARPFLPVASSCAEPRTSIVRLPRAGRGSPSSAGGNRNPDDEDELTRVALRWIEGRTEDELLFGLPSKDTVIDRHARILSFQPGVCVAVSRRTMNRRGTSISRLDVFMTVHSQEAYTTIPHVRPGGDILLSVRGWTKIAAVLDAIAAIESIGIDPRDAAPDHWRHVHNRLAADLPPRLYSRERHEAFVARSASMGRSR